MSEYLSAAVYGDDQERPLHFGDPVGEQLAYEAGKALAVLGPAGVVRVSGPDSHTWLTTLSSQVITGKQPGVSQELLLLDPNGRIEFAAGVIHEENGVALLVEREVAPDLVKFLESMIFMSQVSVEDVSADYTAFGSVGRLPNADVTTWEDPWPGTEEGGARYFQGWHPGAEHRLVSYLVPTGEAARFVEAVGLPLAGSMAAEATRVAAWRPRVSTEVDDRAMPAELDWLRTAVHVNKGCYRGQESIARILNLGKPPRRLTFLQLDGSRGDLPSPGDAVEFGGRQVGVLTSVARHAEMGPIALALLKRGLDPEAELEIGEVAAAQELIVPVDGKSDHSPAERPGAGLRRLGGRDLRTRGAGSGG